MMKKICQIILAAGLLLSLQTGTAHAVAALPDGLSPGTPLVSVQQPDGSYRFAFEVAPNVFYYIDPDIAIGYDYEVQSGPSIASVLLPSVGGDTSYDLWTWDLGTSSYFDSGIAITAGTQYQFGSNGVYRFRIMGIDPAAGLDPADANAFVTGLTFSDPGSVTVTQTPVIITVPVPEPSAMLLLGTGIAGLASFRLRKKI